MTEALCSLLGCPGESPCLLLCSQECSSHGEHISSSSETFRSEFAARFPVSQPGVWSPAASGAG